MGYTILEQPSIVDNGQNAFMYYDYGTGNTGEIGMATALIDGIVEKKKAGDHLIVTTYPSPISRYATFIYTLNEPVVVSIHIYDNFGRLVATPLHSWKITGEQQVIWDSEELPSGIYYYSVQAGNKYGSGKLIKLQTGN
jgi:hypothetical protein